MMESAKCRHLIGGALIGASIGVLAGFLFAPRSGRALRDDLKERAAETIDEAKHFYSKTQTRTEDLLEKARQKAGEQLDRVRAKASQIAGRFEGSSRPMKDVESPDESYGEA